MAGSSTYPLEYVDCDIPAGVTLSEWRRRRRPVAARPSRLVAVLRRASGLR